MRMHEHEKRGSKKRSLAVNTALRAFSLLICPGDDILAATLFSQSAFKGNLPPAILPEKTRLVTVYESKINGKRVIVI